MPDSADEWEGSGNDLEDASEIDSESSNEENLEAAYEERQRELLTSVLDYNLYTLSELISEKQIDLSPRYQRRDRWRADRQSRLIESFMMNVPVPPVFLNEDDYGKYSVIDGKQRLTAIHEFIRGRLKLRGLRVFKELNGYYIENLPPSLRNVVTTRANLRAVIILRQSHHEIKFEVFRRLNTGGVSLNPQEIRNSTWPGPLNELLLDLSERRDVRRLLGITESSALYKEMRDVELILRFFAFKDDWDTFRTGMSKRLDTYMADNQRPGRTELVGLEADFDTAIKVVDAAFGDYAFRRYVPERSIWRKPVLAALWDAHMFGAMEFTEEQVAPHKRALQNSYRELFSDLEFRQSIDAATNTPQLFRRRVEIIRSMIRTVVEA